MQTVNLLPGGIQQIRIRRMQEKDLEQVQAIDRLSFSLPWPAKAYRYELTENPSSLQWVAVITQPITAVVGVIVVWLILDEAHIATIAVHPDYRSQGIAQELLSAALSDAIGRGANQSTLEVRAGNQIAQKLYFRFGYKIVGNRPRYYKDNHEDALIMTVGNLDEKYLRWLEESGWKQSGWSGTTVMTDGSSTADYAS